MQEDKGFKNSLLPAQYKMRYYENEYPEPNELVMAQVKNSEENGCYVYLLEYDMKQGMIPLNEYSKIMTKAIHRVMKVGKKQVLRVLRVDKQKGYIDLSKKSVFAEDQKIGEQKYANSAMVHSILIHISQKSKVPIKQLYETIIWPLYKKKKETHPLIFLKSIMLHEDRIQELGIKTPEVKSELLNEIKRRFKTSILKTMAEFSVQIKSYEGINAIKRILQAGVDAAKKQNYDVKISIIGAPKYTCFVQTPTKDTGKQALSLTLDAMKKLAAEIKGDFKVDREPKTVGDVNAHIQELVEREKLQNQGEGSEEEDEDEA